jgi:competence protein ComEA
MTDINNPITRNFNAWTMAGIALAVVIIFGVVFIGVKSGQGRGVEITLEPENLTIGQLYVGGEVKNPGIYPLRGGDTIEDILKAAGGPTDNADTGRLELSIKARGEAAAPQKVDINRAEAWLLAALPGIGETRAQAIVQYRQKNGPFRDVYELLKVPGLGDTILAGIKDRITAGE